MSWRHAKTSGWAALDQKQRQKDILEALCSDEPFPSLPNSVSSFQPSETFSRNKHCSSSSFSSVILPSVDFPAPELNNRKSKPCEVGSSGGHQSSEIFLENKFGPVFRQLKQLCSWADDSLVECIIAAAGNDFDTVSSFLKAIVEEHKNVKVVKGRRDSMEPVSNSKTLIRKQDVPSRKTSEPVEAFSVLEACADDNNKNARNEFPLRAEKLFDDDIEINSMLGKLTCVPVEPEWEEDDVYLNCRKDAIKMMRAATGHSKAATDSFLRGDHVNARQFSLKAREEREAAKRLNAKAAREILSIQNANKGIWKLDLHGLHATEAVQALQEHLRMIETQVFSKGSSSSGLTNSLWTKADAWRASHPDGYNNVEKSDEQAFHRQKPIWLEVITGIGKHSRGAAMLPTAVRSFLTDNGYRFDEARPGVIMVRPKFRFC